MLKNFTGNDTNIWTFARELLKQFGRRLRFRFSTRNVIPLLWRKSPLRYMLRDSLYYSTPLTGKSIGIFSSLSVCVCVCLCCRKSQPPTAIFPIVKILLTQASHLERPRKECGFWQAWRLLALNQLFVRLKRKSLREIKSGSQTFLFCVSLCVCSLLNFLKFDQKFFPLRDIIELFKWG